MKAIPTKPDTYNRPSSESLIDEEEASAFLGHSVRTLQKWRVRGGGPRFVRISRRSIRYRRSDLLAWIEARVCANTSAPITAETYAQGCRR